MPTQRTLNLLKLGMLATRLTRAAAKITSVHAWALEDEVRPVRFDQLRDAIREARAELDRITRLLDARKPPS